MQLQEISEHNTKIWLSDTVATDFQVEWFEHSQLPLDSLQSQWQSGRQSIVRFKVGMRNMVMRHYCRGGLPAQLSKDQFVFQGFESSRPFKELKLLQRMRQLELPVPEPIAARCIRKGVLYRADIIMSEIANTKTLAQILSENQLAQEVWVRVGQMIRQFHQQGIEHVDLNANNILLDQAGDIYLIDFDRCVQKPYSPSWAQAGLKRLKRSLDKQKANVSTTYFQASDFDSLMQGYQL